MLARALLARPDVLFIDDIAGVLDDDARRQVERAIVADRSLGVIEATVDTPLITDVDRRIELADESRRESTVALDASGPTATGHATARA